MISIDLDVYKNVTIDLPDMHFKVLPHRLLRVGIPQQGERYLSSRGVVTTQRKDTKSPHMLRLIVKAV